jgi:hypothetical protein
MGSSQAKPSGSPATDDISSAAVPAFLTLDAQEQEKSLATIAIKEKLYAKLKSSYKPVKEEDQKINLIEAVHNEDYEGANYLNALRMPVQVQKDLQSVQELEALRRCFPIEKKMASCLQDKMWTAWKCQKERDTYYKCVDEAKANSSVLADLRWKYTMGTFHGETMARGNIMKALWKDYFPARDLPHQWVKE